MWSNHGTLVVCAWKVVDGTPTRPSFLANIIDTCGAIQEDFGLDFERVCDRSQNAEKARENTRFPLPPELEGSLGYTEYKIVNVKVTNGKDASRRRSS